MAGDDVGYPARWRPSSVPPEAAAFARQVVAGCGPLGRDRAKNLLWAHNYAKSRPTGQDRRHAMADHGEVEYATADGMDYPTHEQTYRNFITLVKGVLGVVVVILILMAIFLA